VPVKADASLFILLSSLWWICAYACVTARKKARTCSGAQAGAAWLQGELDAVRNDQVAPDLDGPGAPWRWGQGAGGLLLQQLADPFQRQSGQLPLPHQQKLLDVALCVVGALADAQRAIDQSGLDVVPDGATRQLGKSSDLVERERLWFVHGSHTRQYNCTLSTVTKTDESAPGARCQLGRLTHRRASLA
jgi:hypothetical protein